MANRPGGRWTDELARVSEAIARYCGELGFALDPAARIDSISVAERQRVEIVKVLMSGARILILDEPTAVLTDDEADRLLGVVRGLAGRGAAVVLITHKLREVRDFADRVTIMQGGRTVAEEDPKTLSDQRMTELMVGSAPRSAVTARGGGGRVRLAIETWRRRATTGWRRSPASPSMSSKGRFTASPGSAATARPSSPRC